MASGEDKPTSQHQPVSTTELFSSAKVVAEAAQSTFNKEGDKVDKAKVAGAAEDLLGAASQYGKLEEKGLGQYVEKAETYLHQYHPTDSAATAKPTAPDAKPDEQKEATPPATSQPEEGGGFGAAFKMAQGFLK
ncbi:hypothetical protein Tsubulata_047232 [Turnera subulata]|uniref:Nodulin-related protein 1 n=1 Tax=Turnera subulata TaxID=218843 RepID=A0A9Q0JCD4_9ROSI|nr:hypothetical protein Tsubulata_024698 [Turnera subulata]KAJ4850983.1 hypothetical protein Tsubulata_047232 [Turnera subulata]